MLAVRQGVVSAADSTAAQLRDALSQRGRLGGLSRTYKPGIDGGHVYAPLSRLFDVVLVTEATNATAVADLKVGSLVIATNVPATYFLFLERELGKLRGFVDALPTLDEAEDWTKDGAPAGQWRSTPTVTDKTHKVPRNHVKWEPPDATYTQQAQVETFAEDIPEGTWTLYKFSGAIPAATKAKYLDRITALQEAVKLGREEANGIPVVDRSIGDQVLAYVFGG
jgi:hypothetical protein